VPQPGDQVMTGANDGWAVPPSDGPSGLIRCYDLRDDSPETSVAWRMTTVTIVVPCHYRHASRRCVGVSRPCCSPPYSGGR